MIKHLLAVCALLLTVQCSGWAAWSKTASIACAQSSNGSAPATTAAVNTTGANLIVVVVVDFIPDSTALSDSAGNSYTGLTQQTQANRTRLFYKYSPTTSASHTFTATPATTSYPAICVLAFSGSAASPFDQQNGNVNAASTSLTTGSVTPSENGELLIAGWGDSGALSGLAIDSSFTLETPVYLNAGAAYGAALAWRVQTTAAAINPTWSWTTVAAEAVVIATFKVAATSGGSSLTLLGVGGDD